MLTKDSSSNFKEDSGLVETFAQKLSKINQNFKDDLLNYTSNLLIVSDLPDKPEPKTFYLVNSGDHNWKLYVCNSQSEILQNPLSESLKFHLQNKTVEQINSNEILWYGLFKILVEVQQEKMITKWYNLQGRLLRKLEKYLELTDRSTFLDTV